MTTSMMRLAVWTSGMLACMGVGPGAAAQDAGRDSSGLLLRDFDPQSTLKVEEHPVRRGKFPVIDFHGHLARANPDETVRLMDACHVRMIVDFDGGSGPQLERQIERFSAYPGRFIHFARIDWRLIDDPEFSAKAAAQLEQDVKRGARGLKISKALGLYTRDKSGRLVAVNDPRLDAIWARCGELGIPVAIHTADPDAFFLPVDGNNELYDSLIRNPAWSFHGDQFPSKRQLLDQHDDVIARHPGTIFVGLHMASRSENLADVGELLDRFPNLHVEFGARVNDLGRQPYTARKFFLKYADRILFGVDWAPPNLFQYGVYFRFLETYDEYFRFSPRPGLGRWNIYGIGLPDDVLEKVYFTNARRLLKLP